MRQHPRVFQRGFAFGGIHPAKQGARTQKKGGAEAPPLFNQRTGCFLVNQVFGGLDCAVDAQSMTVEFGTVEQESEIPFGGSWRQRTRAESADVCERMAELERSLRDHIANESGSAVVETPLLATTGRHVGHNLTRWDDCGTRAS